MNTSAIQKTVRIVSYYTASAAEGDRIIEELLKPKNDILINYLRPFSEELNINLLELETANGKRDFIKFCIFEFFELQTFYRDNFHLFTEGYAPIDRNGKKFSRGKMSLKATKMENYIIVSYELIDMLFNEIVLCCFKYKIDFYEICQELSFDHNFVDTSLYAYLVERDEKGIKKNPTKGFETYLKKGGKNLSSSLTKMYKNGKPESIAYMLFALVDLKLLDASLLSNQTKLHFILSDSFGKIGTRQNLNININKLRTPDEYQAMQLEVYRKEIKEILSR